MTGAAHGIGRATAGLLASLGARVVAVDADRSALDESFSDSGCLRCTGDLAGGDICRLADDIHERYGPVALLVNNVGINTPSSFLELGEEDFDRVFATNLRGPWFFTKRLVEHLVSARSGGAIVFVSSLHDSTVFGFPGYSASKAAIAMLVKELAAELAPQGIRVNAVSPGAIRTASNAMPGPDEARFSRLVPLGRVGEPIDVARTIAVLLSDDWSGYVTGANVRVDGGLALHSWANSSLRGEERDGQGHRLLGRVRRGFSSPRALD